MENAKNTKNVIFTIIFSILILIFSQIISELIASVFFMIKIPEFICNSIAGILYVVICYRFLKIMCNKYLKSDMNDYYIPKFKLNLKWIIVGIILPLLVVGTYLLLPGTFHKSNLNTTEVLNLLSVGIIFTGISAGIVEEMVFRGMIMGAIEKRYNKKIAILIPSMLFGFVHTIGMDFDISSCLQVLVAGTFVGIMFSLIASEEKSIWNSAIVHIFWNIIIIGGFINIGTSISESSLYSYVLNTKSFLLTGGEFGIESSIISVIAYILVSLVAFYCIKKNT